ncbi:MAG TPA: glycosyltransferase [Pirellulales bacterium]|nr:glycosyltransferase [Pirellulales bacterium]
MKQVAWLFEYPTLLGGERSLLAALGVLRSLGWQPLAVGPAEGPLADELDRQGVENVVFSVFDRYGARLPRPTLHDRLRQILEQRRPDLLHANSLSMGRLSGLVAAEAGLPSIAHLRDIVGMSAAAVADLNRHTRLLAVSRATRDFHTRQGLRDDLCHVCYNGVDLETFRLRAPTGWLHRKLRLPPETSIVLSIGQLVLRKGHDVLVRAAARLRESLPHLHWVIAGARFSQKAEAVQYEADLHAAVAAAGMSERFHFLGTVANVPELLSEATLLVHPARQEPLGRVLLEAAAAGVPCVATDVGGMCEIFGDAPAAALLTPPDDERALAEAVAALMAAPAVRVRLGQAARRRAEELFDAHANAAALAEHYRAVCERARRLDTNPNR